MGEALKTRRLSDAAGGRASRGVASRPVVRRFARDARGATAIEYALLIAILGLGIITAASGLKNQIYNTLNDVGNAMDSAGD